MELKELKQFAGRHDNFDIRVITHAGSHLYQVELEDVEGCRHLLMQRNKPMLFRALDEVYTELKRAGIHRAYLIQHVAHDELIGHEAYHHEPVTPRMPLSF
ncbi:DUF6482 family protein [Vreelandella subglaciescola]|jgi:hypothetical protein|uniref:Uncharacterized protein n=1 Tax=Vreelandella subglaciescola TaxID=29571 RepID=A0A1M7FNC9_9GAMM|nr:DUF6482 family protein [Halomonas subglaciescola]SHM05268.1 hypothetical protein SAMN05878437_0979 [Halomonas subglaciescola]